MTAPDISHLRRLAEAATPGPWECREDGPTTEVCRVGHGYQPAICDNETYYPAAVGVEDQRFIAAANPTVVLALLDEIEAARRVVEAARKAMKRLDRDMIPCPALSVALSAYDRAIGAGGEG